MSELVVIVLIRAARILRIVRIVKLYKYLAIRQERGKRDKSSTDDVGSEDEERPGSPDRLISHEQMLLSNMRRQSVATLVTFEDVDSDEVNNLLEEELYMDEASESHIGAAMSDITTRRCLSRIDIVSLCLLISRVPQGNCSGHYNGDNYSDLEYFYPIGCLAICG
jgi:hypothetical protein